MNVGRALVVEEFIVNGSIFEKGPLIEKGLLRIAARRSGLALFGRVRLLALRVHFFAAFDNRSAREIRTPHPEVVVGEQVNLLRNGWRAGNLEVAHFGVVQ